MGGDGHARHRPSRAAAASADQAAARLVMRIQAGEPGAFEELYEQLFGPLYGYMLSFVRRDEAEDVVQRVFERLIGAIPRYELRDDSSVRGWLFRIARNEALDYRGRRDQAEALSPGDLVREIEGRASHRGGPRFINVGWVSDAALANALRSLTVTQREVIVLYYVADLTLRDVAIATGLSEPAVRQHHRRALAALQERLSGSDRRGGPGRPRLGMRRISGWAAGIMGGSFSVARS